MTEDDLKQFAKHGQTMPNPNSVGLCFEEKYSIDNSQFQSTHSQRENVESEIVPCNKTDTP